MSESLENGNPLLEIDTGFRSYLDAYTRSFEKHMSGGQLDYVHGAQMAERGKSFIAIPSTYTDKKGQLQSRIVLNFPAGTAVTTPRTEVQYVATEYGCVNMKGLSRADKCRELIALAHPQFRPRLFDQAKEVGLI